MRAPGGGGARRGSAELTVAADKSRRRRARRRDNSARASARRRAKLAAAGNRFVCGDGARPQTPRRRRARGRRGRARARLSAGTRASRGFESRVAATLGRIPTALGSHRDALADRATSRAGRTRRPPAGALAAAGAAARRGARRARGGFRQRVRSAPERLRGLRRAITRAPWTKPGSRARAPKKRHDLAAASALAVFLSTARP